MNFHFKIILLISISFFFITRSSSQIPPFRIALTDSTYYNSKNLPKNIPLMIIYFSATCKHCKEFTGKLINHIKDFQKFRIMMISNEPLDQIKNFENNFHLRRFSNIVVGTESYTLVVHRYYSISTLPYVALFNSNGRLIHYDTSSILNK